MSNTTKSIYDKIETAKDLIFEVKAHGLSTKIEDICRAQDIFGNSPVEELETLANDKNRSREFYQIIFTIWNWEDATRFYNQTSNPAYIEGREAVKEIDKLKAELNRKNERIAELNGEIADFNEALQQMHDEKVDYQKEIDEKDALIIKLKARLYDLMVTSGK